MNCCRWWRFDEHAPITGGRDRWQQLLLAGRPEEAREVALHRLHVAEVVSWWVVLACRHPANPPWAAQPPK